MEHARHVARRQPEREGVEQFGGVAGAGGEHNDRVFAVGGERGDHGVLGGIGHAERPGLAGRGHLSGDRRQQRRKQRLVHHGCTAECMRKRRCLVYARNMITPAELLDAARDGLSNGVAPSEDGGDCAARVSLWRGGQRLAEAEASADDAASAVRVAAAALRDADREGASLFAEAATDEQALEVEGLGGLLALEPDGSGLLLRDGDREARGLAVRRAARGGAVRGLGEATQP